MSKKLLSLSTLPLGAVRTDDGAVVVPESRRADGSVRKAIRIRQGYVPQDEVPKYKPIGQRLREQQAKRSETSVDAVAAEIETLSLQSSANAAAPEPRERSSRPQTSKTPRTKSIDEASTKELKSELSIVNKSLREITKLESFAVAFERGDDKARPLTAAQQRRVERKASLERRREELLAALNAAPDEEKTPPVKSTGTLRVIEL